VILRGVVLRGRRGRGGGDGLALRRFGLFGFVDVGVGSKDGSVSDAACGGIIVAVFGQRLYCPMRYCRGPEYAVFGM
jgi:hypothetical protein